MRAFLARLPGARALHSRSVRAGRYLTDPARRRRAREKRADFIATRKAVGAWASQPQVGGPQVLGIVGFTDLPLHAKLQAVVAKSLHLHGFRTLVFTPSGARAAHRLYRLFGIRDLVTWDALGFDQAAWAEASSFISRVRASKLVIPEVTALRFHGVDVGKHALSMTCRRLVVGHLDLEDPETSEMFFEQLTDALRSVLTAERFFDDNRVDKLLVRDSGYIPNGPIFEVALERGIDCVVYEQGQRRGTWVFKRYTPSSKGAHYFSISDETWKTTGDLPWGPEQEAVVEREFAGRYRPDSTDDTRRLMTGTKVRSADEVRSALGLDPSRKTVIVFSHLAWDATFFYGECLFDDFEDWLYRTVRFAAEEGAHLNWVIKLHPFNVFKLQRETREEESEMSLLRDLMPLPEHIKIVRADTDINASSLFTVADCVLTVNGTVGMEFPCFGIPAILGGSGRYSGRGFTVDPPSREAYFDALRALGSIGRLTDDQVQLARRHFLALMLGRQTDLSDVAEMVLLKQHEAQSDVHDNLEILPRSLEAFAAAGSVRRLGEWFAVGSSEDLLELEAWGRDTGGSAIRSDG